ncbi:MAG: RidA family protein [Alphaproteobacteria bacterium]|nr:RidA family protein [Alphaproteobacteria bacterium]
MTRQLISSSSTLENNTGYSRAVIEDGWIFISSTAGFDYKTMFISDNIHDQTHKVFENIISTLKEARASLEDIVQMRYYLVESADWLIIRPILHQYFNVIRPATTAIICGLVDPRVKIEVEIIAKQKKDNSSCPQS